jgi:isopenicillin N synthase-like dioxygenase
MTFDEIPALSLKLSQRDALPGALDKSFREYGFAIVRDHGIPSDLIAQGCALAQAFFALPEAAKRRYIASDGGGQRGFTPMRTEIAKGAKASDLKEFWHVGREAKSSISLPEGMPLNIWPEELPGFRPCFNALFAELDRVGALLLSAIAAELGLDLDWFSGPTEQGNSILRLLHYPPLQGISDAVGDSDDGAIRAAAHEDINLITLLLGAEEAGLQLLRKDGRWMDIRPPEGALVVNIGDMLQRLTNNMLPSTTHRVVNPPKHRQAISRYSMPFFVHLRPDFLIEPLPQCVSAVNPGRYAAISANDYLRERLKEIGLMSAEKF